MYDVVITTYDIVRSETDMSKVKPCFSLLNRASDVCVRVCVREREREVSGAGTRVRMIGIATSLEKEKDREMERERFLRSGISMCLNVYFAPPHRITNH